MLKLHHVRDVPEIFDVEICPAANGAFYSYLQKCRVTVDVSKKLGEQSPNAWRVSITCLRVYLICELSLVNNYRSKESVSCMDIP